MKLNLKSRKGFTLIELLVVIGILAVLAAIAIPSVAGLIDRANVSADKTNSNEMTNAIERFTSEYELYCQDIASGALDPDNLDSAQGRVKNVVDATTRSGIEGIEFAQNATVADDVIAIYRDTKYPMNAYTMQKVVENYTKTSSSTFEPKQSDMHYWYSPDCGVVVVAEPTKTATELDKYVISGMDAKGNDITSDSVNAQWIDLTLGVALSGDASLDMSTVSSILAENDWATIQKVIKAGKIAEAGWNIGDTTPSFTINGTTKTAKIIGINQDGTNTVTFMVSSDITNGAEKPMNADGRNIGGWKDSEMRTWLNGSVYNNMTPELKNIIKSVNKISNSGYTTTGTNSTKDYLFLLSVNEVGITNHFEKNGWTWYEEYKSDLYNEGNVYAYFLDSSNILDFGTLFWLRSANCNSEKGFFYTTSGKLGYQYVDGLDRVIPAFVIG